MTTITQHGHTLRSRGVLPSDTMAARAAVRAEAQRIAVHAHDVCDVAWSVCDALIGEIERGAEIDAVDVIALCERADDVASVQAALAAVVSDHDVSHELLELSADVRGEIDAAMRAIYCRVAPHWSRLRVAVRGTAMTEKLASVAWPYETAWWIRMF